uniref:Uncharacterized protein n=1 Tax=Lepeophtheirus salmonis TaxID=72036 RepID=A0A0K2UMF1_LEPSM
MLYQHSETLTVVSVLSYDSEVTYLRFMLPLTISLNCPICSTKSSSRSPEYFLWRSGAPEQRSCVEIDGMLFRSPNVC